MSRSIPRSPRRSLSWLGLAVLGSLLVLAVMAPAAISANTSGGSAFSELTEGRGETTTATASTHTSASTTSEATNSRTLIILAMVAAVALLIGIAYVIVRDARRVAPAGDPRLVDGVGANDWAARQRKRRVKAKAARRQRKRNR